MSTGNSSFLLFMGEVTRCRLGRRSRARLVPSAKGLVFRGQGERVEAQALLWALTAWDGADTPGKWGEAEGTPCLWVFPSCSSSC